MSTRYAKRQAGSPEAGRVFGFIRAHDAAKLILGHRVQQHDRRVLGGRGEGEGGQLVAYVVVRVAEPGVAVPARRVGQPP